ncbi:MAG: hypothetical protein DME76_19780 [Verrucomicrobia bacterium]|nr:MAG: hypothetical protein DME76_19780 [Verrucomicrobiota bacterium]
MNCAITGATGFVGSLVKTKMIDAGHYVTSLPRPWHLGSNIDALVHCAAYVPPSHESSEAQKCLTDNSIATLQLLEQTQSTKLKVFVYISAGLIYKFSSSHASEEAPVFPSNRAPYYLASKLVGDIFVDHFRHSSKMRVVTLRPSSVYGPGMKQGFLPRITAKLKNDEPISPEDVGNYPLDLVHVDDVAGMAVKVATDSTTYGIYNIGGGAARPTSVIVKLLAELMGKKYNCTASIPVQASHAPLDISRAQNIGYRPTRLLDGLKSYVESLND